MPKQSQCILIGRRWLLACMLCLASLAGADSSLPAVHRVSPLPVEVVQVILTLAKTTGSVTTRPGEAKADAATLLSSQFEDLKRQLDQIRVPTESVESIRAVGKQYAAAQAFPSDVNLSASAMQALTAVYFTAQASAERKGEADRKQDDERTRRWLALGVSAALLALVVWLIAKPPADRAMRQLAPLVIGALLGYWLKP